MESLKTLFLFITLNILSSSCMQANSHGFSTSFIHRDSMFSPYFDSSKTYYQNIHNSIRRALDRSTHFFTTKLASSTIQSPLTAEPAEYLMKISVGTPPVDLLAVADTGSDLTWTQCQPCIECYPQDTPFFNPQKSSTYANQACESDACQSLSSTSCDNNGNCNYEVTYGDQSFSKGNLASESFTFESTSGNPVVLPNISFGCGHLNAGKFDKFTTGIVGLGNGELSIVNQLSDTINGKFSYCLAPVNKNVSSKISFGSDAVVSGPGVQSTPFYTNDQQDTFYNLNLESVSVGNANIKFESKKKYSNKASGGESNIIIDSGTTVTFLPTDFYQKFQDEFTSAISSKPTEPQGGLNVCYKNEEGLEDKVPTVTFHFSGADVDLSAVNTLLEVAEDVVCLSILPASDDLGAIFGNLQQMNYLIGYDLDSKTVSFKKSDCTNV
ncbi:aspartic proteinase CDR1-like [Heracleum sosnowskyi]|uniref:Aspartic proteinase CDR1-like n=1 Tax=Heracleum sosnowskyi TaxID=360622 RepID=A0AAD8IH44_9APIA|nr:aspartic proteinase CDR1-like [Heracleum sosnowskyi]